MVVDVDAIPKFDNPNVDMSDWMSTNWDGVQEKWRVNINLNSAPARHYTLVHWSDLLYAKPISPIGVPERQTFDLACADTTFDFRDSAPKFLKTATGQYQTKANGWYDADIAPITYFTDLWGTYEINFAVSNPQEIDACHQWGAID